MHELILKLPNSLFYNNQIKSKYVYSYTNFFIDIANEFNNAEKIKLLNISLPIGISFFTFTQIAYLMDSHQGKVRENSLINYK